jgi:hypothetical protein
MRLNSIFHGIVLVVAATLCATASASATKITRLVVLPFAVSTGVESKQRELLDEIFLTEISRDMPVAIKVVGASDILAVLDQERQKQLAGCDNTSCMVEIGNALGASHLVHSSFGKVGGQFALTTKMIGVADANFVYRDAIYVDDNEDALLSGVRQLSRRLVQAQGWIAAPGAGPSLAERLASPPFIIGAAVAGLGFTTLVAAAVGAFYFDGQANAASATWPQKSGASMLALGCVAGGAVGALATAIGATVATMKLVGDGGGGD